MSGARIIIAGMLLAAAVAGFRYMSISEWFTAVETLVSARGAVGPVATVPGHMAAAVLLIPGSAITIGAG